MTQNITAAYPFSSAYTDTPSLTDRFLAWRDTLPARSAHGIAGGVCAGLGEHWGISPNLVRAGVLLAAVLPGPMWALYLAAWVLLPSPRRF